MEGFVHSTHTNPEMQVKHNPLHESVVSSVLKTYTVLFFVMCNAIVGGNVRVSK